MLQNDIRPALPGIDAVLDAIGVGVMMLDDQGLLRLANQLARGELGRGETLACTDGRLRAVVARQQGELSCALAQAHAGRRSMLSLGHGDGAQLFALVPLQPLATADGPGKAHVLVLFGRSPAHEPTALMLLAQALGLTQCERDVLEFLCSGLGAPEIARQRDVKVSTVRTQISSLRSKVGARSVPHLIAKLATLPPLTGVCVR